MSIAVEASAADVPDNRPLSPLAWGVAARPLAGPERVPGHRGQSVLFWNWNAPAGLRQTGEEARRWDRIKGANGMAELSAVGLSAALDALRDELESAWQASQGRRVRFRTSEVTLTVETVARLDKDGSGKIRWWLVEAGAA
jgi:hypothetical protein